MAPCMKALGRAGFGRRRHASERIARTGQIKLAMKPHQLLGSRVDLGDVSPRKLYHGRDPSVRLVWFDEQDAT